MSMHPSERPVPVHGPPLTANGETRARPPVGARLRTVLLPSIRRYFRPRSAAAHRMHEPPIRAELFSTERLELHAEGLAAAQEVRPQPTPDRRLERRLRDNDRALRMAYHATLAAVREDRAATPAA